MYDEETGRDRAVPSYQRLRIMVRRHFDQMMKTPNFRARNERIETGVKVISQKKKKKKASVERRMGECFLWKAN